MASVSGTTKSVEFLDGSDAERGSLRRVLGPWALTSLGVGAIIGAGIFLLTGLAAREQAGPAIILSFVVAGLGSAFCALCYAEFAAMLPVAGGAYAYAYASLGKVLAWIIGWDLILEYGVGAAAVATGWAYYFLRLLETVGIQFPPFLAADPILTEGAWLNLPAFAVVLILTAVLVTGIRQSAGFSAFMVAVKIVIVLFVIVVGAFFVQSANWKPFAPFGISGVMSGAAYVFFAYIGFDAVSTHAEEARRPQRDVPTGILASLSLCTLLYMLVAWVLTGMVSYREIDINAPVAAAFLSRGVHWAGLLISVGAVVGLTSVLLVILLSLARVIFAVARDGLLPRKLLGVVHPRFRTPHIATIVGGGAVSLSACVLVLRKSQPHTPRPFRCPWVPVIPVLGIVFNLAMMLSLGWVNWLRLVGWFMLGLVIYWSYGRKHNVLRQH